MIFNFKETKVNYILTGFDNKKSNTIPILFLHGWGGSISSFLFCTKVLKNKKCILLDFPPFGSSTEPKKAWTVKDYSNLVLSLCSFLNINKVNIVAHSFGGRVAIELASNTQLVNKLILTSSAGVNKKKLKVIIKEKLFKIRKALCKLRLYSFSKLNKMGSEDYKNLTPTMKQTFVNVVNYNQAHLLCKIKIPTLLFWGKEDKETPFYFTKIFKKHIKDCEVVSFENSGHFVYLQKPNTFIKVIDYFFKD